MKKRKIISMCLAILLLVMTGCGNKGEGADIPSGAPGSVGDTEGTKSSAESDPNVIENAKGRFLESDVKMPEMTNLIRAMERLEDGRIACFDGSSGMYISEDNGESFSMKELAVMDEILKDEKYVSGAAVGKDGSLLIQYYEEDGNNCIYVDKDGNEVSRFKEEKHTFCYSFLSDGRLVGGNNDGVFEIDPENGAMTKICDSKSTVQYIKQVGDYLYFAEDNRLECYNLSTNSFENDEVLEEFVKEDLNFGNADSYPVLICEGDTEDSLYVLNGKGLFRHVIKGSVMEEVIKGSLGSMGSPAYYLSGIAFLDKENLLICYNGNMMKAYKYDPDISAVPEHELSVYSLKENDALRVAINMYQQANPDTYLSYEVGMTGTDGMTREDAIRNLNTALLSGEGPDILVLDGLPIESYIEKGILMDLSADIGAKYPGSLYENITDAYKNDKGTCAVPVFFAFHLCAGEDVGGINDLTALADKVEALRRENPDGNIIGSYLEKEVVTRFYDVSSPGFIKEDGSIDRERLTEYLTQVKRIWDVESTGLDPDKVKQRAENYDYFSEMAERDDWCSRAAMYDTGYMAGECRIILGEEDSLAWGYTDIISVFKALNKEMDIRVLSGFSGNVFIPRTVMGVNASGSQKEAAADFVMSMLSKEVQTEARFSGFPVNREAALEQLDECEPSETYGWTSSSDEQGNSIDLEIKWLDETEQAQLKEMLESLDTPAKLDENVKDAVINVGTEVLKGRMNVDEGVNEIINRVQIYLAE